MTTYLAHHAGGWRNAFALEAGILAVVAIGGTRAASPAKPGDRAAQPHRQDGTVGDPERDVLGSDRASGGGVLPRGLDAVIQTAQRSNSGYRGRHRRGRPTPRQPSWRFEPPAAVLNRSLAAYAYLATAQTSSHGYALLPGARRQPVDVMGDSGRHRCHLRAARRWRGSTRQLPSGAYNYQPGETTTPAFVTGQVLPAVNGKAYPIG
jgi:hypothetical protein